MKFKPGDIVVAKKGTVLRDRRGGKVMIVIESFRARKDQGTYYRVLCGDTLEFRHEAQLCKIKD